MGFVLVGALLVHVWWSHRARGCRGPPCAGVELAGVIGAALAAGFVAFLSESMGTTTAPALDASYVAVLAVGPVAMVVGVVYARRWWTCADWWSRPRRGDGPDRRYVAVAVGLTAVVPAMGVSRSPCRRRSCSARCSRSAYDRCTASTVLRR